MARRATSLTKLQHVSRHSDAPRHHHKTDNQHIVVDAEAGISTTLVLIYRFQINLLPRMHRLLAPRCPPCRFGNSSCGVLNNCLRSHRQLLQSRIGHFGGSVWQATTEPRNIRPSLLSPAPPYTYQCTQSQPRFYCETPPVVLLYSLPQSVTSQILLNPYEAVLDIRLQ